MFVFRIFLAAALAVIAGGVAAAPAALASGIPDRAMLRPADLGGAVPQPADAESWPELRPPRPCGMRAPRPAGDRAVSAVVDADRAPVVVMEYVALHPPGGADRYLRRLRAAVRDCPDWRLEKAGTGTLTLRWTQHWEHVDERVTHHTYLTVARAGRAVVLVADLGWETSSGDRDRAERLIRPATRRAAVLR
jgi:hypothetical protein